MKRKYVKKDMIAYKEIRVYIPFFGYFIWNKNLEFGCGLFDYSIIR